MTVLDELNGILASTPSHNFDPAAFLLRCIEAFDRACVSGGELDPREIDKVENACNSYGAVAQKFLDSGFSFAAESLLLDAWHKFSQIQFEEHRRIYRAGIAYYLTKVYLRLGDKGAALRWALYTQADDMLGGHSQGGGSGRQTLLTVLRMSINALSEFNTLALQNLELIRGERRNDWSYPEGFAEDVVRRFALEKGEYAHLFATATQLNEFPLCPAYFSSLLGQVTAAHPNTTAQGDALENLASYIFLLIPGWIPRRNLLDERQAYQTDLVVRNLNPAGNLTAELLGRHFVVECKNLSTAVQVSDVGYFLYRMRLTHAKFGVIIATNDITGAAVNRPDEWAAYQLVRKAFHEDGNVCIVLSLSDLDSLRNGATTIWSILLEKIERVRFGIQGNIRSAS